MDETFADVAPGIGATGGLSFSNGNCVEVIRLHDGTYLIIDTKIKPHSPVWHLSAAQFHKLGRTLATSIGLFPNVLMVDLAGGVNFTMKRTAQGLFVWTLDTPPEDTPPDSFTFDIDEITAFCWGYRRGQFPVDAPIRQLVSPGAPFWRPSR